MSLPPLRSWLSAALAVTAVSQSQALIVSEYNASIHKRLLNFPKLVYQVTPSPNPGFIADASLFRAIGWPESPSDWTRQMALVSPRHMIYATHYTLTPSWQIIFVGNDGNQHLHGIESQHPVINTLGQQTDLMIVTLSTPVDTSLGIDPFPVLNLPTESDYTGKPVLVCGSFVDSGTGTIGGLINLTNDPGFDTTRFIYFDYDRNATNQNPNACRFWYGDSGAPSFVMENGRPAILGTASGFDDLTPNDGIDGPVFRNYIGSIPSYLPQLDALMEPKGYHIKRFYPAATTITTTAASTGTLRRMKTGGVSITANNSGAETAHNVNLDLTFTTAPSSVVGTGWICEAATPLVWKCRRGGISNGASASITATWASLPDAENLPVSIARSYDGAAPATNTASLPILQNYVSWINGVSAPAHDADPDHDGITNLIEYAFGGSPSQSSQFSPDGGSLLPHAAMIGGNLIVRFPWRTDAAVRGLSYCVEFSDGLASGTWGTGAPAGTTFECAASAPGFDRITISVPMNAGRRFVRVRVSLDE